MFVFYDVGEKIRMILSMSGIYLFFDLGNIRVRRDFREYLVFFC